MFLTDHACLAMHATKCAALILRGSPVGPTYRFKSWPVCLKEEGVFVAHTKKARVCGASSSFRNGAPEEIRTPNLLIRSQMLYPVELRARRGLV